MQYCHSGCEIKHEPEYIFELNREHPRQGFFVPFYMHFLEQWSDFRHPEYDFDTGQLVYRDADGNEIRRVGFDGNGERAGAASASARAGAIVPSVGHADSTQQEPVLEY